MADKHGLGMDEFFERANPHVRQWQLSRMLEVDRQGTYCYSDSDRARLVETNVRSVNRHGVSCSANTCGNQRVHEYMAEQAQLISGLSSRELRAFGERLARATRPNPSEYRSAPAAFRAGLRAGSAKPVVSAAAPPLSRHVVAGFAIQERTLSASAAKRPGITSASLSSATVMLLFLLVGAFRELRRSSQLRLDASPAGPQALVRALNEVERRPERLTRWGSRSARLTQMAVAALQ